MQTVYVNKTVNKDSFDVKNELKQLLSNELFDLENNDIFNIKCDWESQEEEVTVLFKFIHDSTLTPSDTPYWKVIFKEA